MDAWERRTTEDLRIGRLATTLCGTQGYEFRYYNQNINVTIKIKKRAEEFSSALLYISNCGIRSDMRNRC